MNLAIERPRFRNDLVAQPIEEEGIRYVDVTDPNSGATFRFYDVEYSIACAMDGARGLGDLAEWTRAELGIETSPDELVSVVNTLAELGYLDALAHAPAASLAEPSEMEPVLAPGSVGGAELAAQVEAEALELSPGQAPTVSRPLSSATSEEAAVEAKTRSFAGVLDSGHTAAPALDVPPSTPDPEPPVAKPEPKEEDEASSAPMLVDDGEDVAVDLSQHLNLSRDEVKEAVRQSQIMQVPVLPPELAGALDGPAQPGPAREPETGPETEKDKEAVPEPVPEEVATSTSPAGLVAPVTAIPLPLSPPAPARPAERAELPKPPARKAPRKLFGGSPFLWIATLAACALGIWYLGLREKPVHEPAAPPASSTLGQAKSPVADSPPRASQPAPDPERPTAKLEMKTSPSVEVRAAAKGAIAWLTPKKTVASGEPIARLTGFQRWEAKLRSATSDLERHQRKLERGKADGNAAEVAHYSKEVPKDEADVNEAKQALAALVIVAPAEGEVEVTAKPGTEVGPNDVVAKVRGAAPALVARFRTSSAAHQSSGNCRVAVKNAPDKQAACVIESAEGGSLVVRIVAAGGALPMNASDDVVLLAPPK